MGRQVLWNELLRHDLGHLTELLQKAVKAGFKNAADVKKDTDLDPLRDRDDFKKLLADLEKPAEKE